MDVPIPLGLRAHCRAHHTTCQAPDGARPVPACHLRRRRRGRWSAAREVMVMGRILQIMRMREGQEGELRAYLAEHWRNLHFGEAGFAAVNVFLVVDSLPCSMSSPTTSSRRSSGSSPITAHAIFSRDSRATSRRRRSRCPTTRRGSRSPVTPSAGPTAPRPRPTVRIRRSGSNPFPRSAPTAPW